MTGSDRSRTPQVRAAHAIIRAYQLTLSALVGRTCRHFPSCSDYADEAIGVHGVWAGAWMGLARISRCNPWGTAGIDLVPAERPTGAAWYTPWRYGRWRGVYAPAEAPDAASTAPTTASKAASSDG